MSLWVLTPDMGPGFNPAGTPSEFCFQPTSTLHTPLASNRVPSSLGHLIVAGCVA